MVDGFYKITNKKSNKVMDVYGAHFSSDSDILCHNFNGGNNQIFYIKNIGDEVYTIMASHSSKYLDVWFCDDVIYRPLKQNKFNDGNNQKFVFVNCGEDYYKIKALHSEMYLTSDETDKIFQDLFQEDDFQIWKIEKAEKKLFNPVVHPNGNYIFTNINSNKVLDVYRFNYGISDVKQNSFNGGNNQIFNLESLEDGSFKIMALHSGMVLDVYGASLNDNAIIKQHPWNGGDNQRFYMEKYKGSIYQIRSKSSLKLLTIKDSSMEDGGSVVQLTEMDDNSQLFSIQPGAKNTKNHPNVPLLPQGYYKIQNVSSKNILDVSGFSKNDGANVFQHHDNGGNNQIFYFKFLDHSSYNIIAAHSDKVLEIGNNSFNDGASLIQGSLKSNSYNQIFYVEPYENYFVLRSKLSNKVLTSTSNESVAQWEQNNRDFKQLFNLIPAKKSKYNFPSGKLPTKLILDVPLINQMPELPTGCEITSITMMLKFSGANVSKVNLANEMPKSTADPNLGFVGNPFTPTGWTIYPPALMTLVKKYAKSSVTLTGCSEDRLKEQIINEKPIVVWVSDMYTFSVHALTMTGFDEKNYYFNDPWGKIKNMSMAKSDFIQKWTKQARRAISY